MGNGIVLSSLLHLALIAVAVWGLPKGVSPPPEPRVIPIEFIAEVAEERSVPLATPKPPLPPEPPSLPAPAPVATPKPPPPPEPPSLPEPAPVEMALATIPEPAPAATPEPPPPKPEPPKAAAPTPAPRPLPVPKVKPKTPPKPAPPPPPKVEAAAPKPKPPSPPKPEKPAAPPKKVEAAAPKPKPAAPKKDDFLSRMRRAVARHPAPAPTALAQAEAQASRLEERGNRLTMSEEDAVRQHIIGCWNPPVGAPDALDMEVRIIGRLRRDGVVQTVELVEGDKLRVRDEAFFRTFAESALRAFYKCKRLPLPPDKYQAWKTFNIGFNLKHMLGE